MANLQEIIQYLDTLLETDKFQLSDKNINGLQVDSSNSQKTQEVNKVCVSVDPGFEVFQKAKDLKANLLILHHGLTYGDNKPIIGNYRDKIAFLLNNNISLYSSHLPLDKHIVYGNAAVIAQKIGLKNLSPAFEYKGVTVGVTGELTTETERDNILQTLSSIIKDYDVRPLFYGPSKIKRIGIATGAAAFSIFDIPKYNLELFITGEQTQSAFHDIKDNNFNVIFAGHYATEVFGVIALGEKLKEVFGVDFEFIDVPTGI